METQAYLSDTDTPMIYSFHSIQLETGDPYHYLENEDDWDHVTVKEYFVEQIFYESQI